MAKETKIATKKLQLDLAEFKEKGLQLKLKCKSGKVLITLPDNIVFSFNPTNKEKTIAKKLLIYLSNRDVISARNCTPEMWNNSIGNGIKSLIEIRKRIVDFNIELVPTEDTIDYPLAFLLNYASYIIGRFLRYTEMNDRKKEGNYMEALDELRIYLLLIRDKLQLIGDSKLVTEAKVQKGDLPNEVDQDVTIEDALKQDKIGFRWVGTTDQLDRLFKELVDNKAIQADTEEVFKKVFKKEVNNENTEIVWQLKDVQLCYLFDELIKSSLLSKSTEYNSAIRDYRFFVKDDGLKSTFENMKGLKQSYINNKTGTPKNADVIDRIINNIKMTENI
jgi:hypothetical protein